MGVKERKGRKRIPLLPQLLCTLALCFTIFIFAPIDMYVLNAPNFWFELGDFVPAFLCYFVVVFAAIQLVLVLARWLPYSLYMLLLAVVFGCTVAIYVQGTYLCMGNEVLGGGAPAWNDMLEGTMSNLGIWAAILLVAIGFMMLKSRLFLKVVSYVSALILVMEGASLAVSLTSTNLSKDLDNIYCTNKDLFVYSENSDVLVFMMDTLDTRLLDRMLAENPEYLDELDGFTYYRNASSSYSRTDPSFVSMLTGEISLNEESFYTYSSNAFKKSQFFQTMVDHGMTVDVYAAPRGVFPAEVLPQIDNLARRDSYVEDTVEFQKVMRHMVAYRYGPLFLQPFFFGEYAIQFNEQQSNAPGTLPETYVEESILKNRLKEYGSSVDNSRRFFKFYAMQGAHVPYCLNRYGESVEYDSVDQYEHTLGAFTVLNQVLRTIKENGAYDNATVIILADHGTEWIGNPTFLVKYPGDTWEDGIKLSMAPVSLLDLRATVLYGAGIDYEAFGTPVHMWEGVSDRERLYYAYDWVKPTGYEFYMNELQEYAVPADATDLDHYAWLNCYEPGQS